MKRFAQAFALVFLLMATASAQQISFSAGPPRSGALHYRLTLEPGQSVTERVRIQNTSELPLEFRVYQGQAQTGPNGVLDGPLHGQEVTGVGTWLSPEKTQVSLGSNERTDVSFQVKVPPGTPPGDHVGFIFVDISPESLDALESNTQSEPALQEDKASFRLRVSTRFGLAVVVRVPGETRAEFSIDSVEKFVRDGRLGLRFLGKNSGNLYLKPDGKWTLFGPDDSVVASQDRQPWGILLPGATLSREIALSTDRPLVRGNYRLEVEASYKVPDAPEDQEPQVILRNMEITLP